jgi:hypothetical protein
VIERSPESARIILIAANTFADDRVLNPASTGMGKRYIRGLPAECQRLVSGRSQPACQTRPCAMRPQAGTHRTQRSKQRADTPLLDVGELSVDRLAIVGTDNQQVILAREGNNWKLPDTGNFPAYDTGANHLLELLQGLKRGMVLAASPGAQKRFM